MTLPARLVVIRSPSNERGEQRDPGRRGEFEREHGGERQQRHRQRPAVLADEMRAVAREMQAHAPSASSARSSGAAPRSAPAAPIRPKPERMVRISKMLRCLAERADGDARSPRTRTARRSSRGRPGRVSMGHDCLRLGEAGVSSSAASRRHSASGWFSGRALSKAASFRQRGVGRDKLRERVERNLEPSRVVDLRHQVDVGERDIAAEAIGAGLDHGFERGEALAGSSGGTRRRSPAAPA